MCIVSPSAQPDQNKLIKTSFARKPVESFADISQKMFFICPLIFVLFTITDAGQIKPKYGVT